MAIFVDSTVSNKELQDLSTQDNQVICNEVQMEHVVDLFDWPSSYIEGLKTIFELKTLPPNWDSYQSPPPPENVLDTAKRLLSFSVEGGYFSPTIMPISGGGVQLNWIVNGRELSLLILLDGSVEYLKVENDLPIEEGDLPSNTHQLSEMMLWISENTD